MHVFNSIFIFFSVSCSTFARPYQYSYYISSPGHYQTLAVTDGAAVVNVGPPLPAGALNPNFRRERVGPGIGQNPQFGRRYPIDQNNLDFNRGREYPYNEDIPNGELDPLFSQGGRWPQDQGRRFPSNRNFGPDVREFDRRYNQIGYQTPGLGRPEFPQDNVNYIRRYDPSATTQFGDRISPPIGLSRLTQEIDESTSADREEVTTQQPCSFCGVDRINPKDGIDDNNRNPDSESIDPESVNNPKVAVENKVVTPANVPGYTYNSPVVPYYVLV